VAVASVRAYADHMNLTAGRWLCSHLITHFTCWILCQTYSHQFKALKANWVVWVQQHLLN